MVGVNGVSNLPAPAARNSTSGPPLAVIGRGRQEAPPWEIRTDRTLGERRAWSGHRLEPEGTRAKWAQRTGQPDRHAWHVLDAYANADGAFLAHQFAQEAPAGLFIDRSGEAARAYDARAGFAMHRAATAGNLNIAV